jgi:hypothetical protein
MTADQSPYRFRIVSRCRQERDPRYHYDEIGRREYAGGLARSEARKLIAQFSELRKDVRPDVVAEESLGTFEGMELWKEVQ